MTNGDPHWGIFPSHLTQIMDPFSCSPLNTMWYIITRWRHFDWTFTTLDDHVREFHYNQWQPSRDSLGSIKCERQEVLSQLKSQILSDPQIRVRNWKVFFLFLNQNTCCGYSKEPYRCDGSFEHPKQMFKLMDKKMIAILRKLYLLNCPYVITLICCARKIIQTQNVFKFNVWFNIFNIWFIC